MSVSVLHVARKFEGVGGVEKHVRELVAYQRKQGTRSDVVVVGTHRGVQVRTRLEQHGRVYETPQLFNYQSAVGSVRFPDILARMARRYDLVHFHYPNPMGEVSYLITAALIQKPTLVTFHGEVVPTKQFSSLYSKISGLFFKRMDRIIVTSPNMLATAQILKRHQQKSVVIPLGIHIEDETPSADSSVFPAEGGPNLLFVGRLARYKGLNTLIAAMNEAPGYLVIVGEGPLEESLRQASRDGGTENRIKFIGGVSDKQLQQIYRSADIFVLPSIDRAEGFGYVLLEAMAASLPMITTDLGTGTSWANLDGETGLVVPPAKSSHLAHAIRRLSGEATLRHQFGVAARARLLKFFEFEKMASAIDFEYSQLV